ncbi:MAG: phage baseplate assembly protein V [Fimbriimonas sp.]
MDKFLGKFRGTVVNNIDPMMLGRVQVSVPDVLADGQMSWAMPCVPYAGSGVGFFAIPPVGANIWVEFEGGNPDFPIWVGCFWGTGEVPASPALPQMTVFKTDAITLTLSNISGAGGFTVEANSPAVALPSKMVMDSSGIEISTGAAKIKLSAAGVSINDGALEVM